MTIGADGCFAFAAATPLDLLADAAMLPRAEVGDLIAVFCAGAYGLSASSTAFLSQPLARELLI